MSKELVISTSPHETKVALTEEGQVVEIYVEREKEAGLVGSIYKGRVTRVLPGMQSAFVDIGLERDAFLYVSDFFEGLEEYEQLAPAEPEQPPFESQEEGPVEAAVAEAEAPQPEAVEARQPVEAQPPLEDERQPAFLAAEPPLQLPERRPQGRPPRGHRRRRHRGGRGRRPEFARGPRPETGPRVHREYTPPVASEPVILPGESIAKYRDRMQALKASEPAQPAAEPRETPPSSEPPEGTSNGPVFSRSKPPESEKQPAGAAEEISAGQAAAAEPASAPAPASEERVSAAPAEAESVPPAGPEPPPPAADVYPDAVTLLEIQRVREYENQVGLPPSVQERTAGGVEWQRHGRGGFDRSRGRGRGRPRPGRDRDRDRRGRRPGGPRTMPARPSRGQPAIAELLRPGQEIIVQIAKEQMGKKGARITSHVTLPGRFLVFMPTIDHIGISRKIGTSEERSRLRRLLLELKGNITGGFVVRTAAAGCSEEDLHQDIDYLVKLWHDIRVRAEESSAPALLHSDLSLVERLLRDQLTAEYDSVWVDSEEEYAQVVDFINRFQPALVGRAKLFTKSAPIFEEMGVLQEIDRALRPKVWLKSGGYIVINHTEALVAIDVNTGKFVGKGSTRLEDTIVKTNLEAVKEISRQIRLRDLGGIIIIDFIDMEDPRNRHRVMRALEDALREDRSPSKLLAFNEFGLVAITRKRSRQSLERVLCQPCPICTGTGMVKSLQTLCYEIQAEARKMAETIDAPELTIRAHPEIVKTLKGKDQNLVRELEEQTKKNIILHSDTGLHFEEYNIY